MRYCKRCLYPEIAVNLYIDDDSGVCSACRVAEKLNGISGDFWAQRRKRFERILEEKLKNRKGDYDCIIPV